MWNNSYGSEIAQWKIDLIIARAKRLGFRRHDLEDVQQQLVLDVAAFEYDEARSNGATECTALTALIDHRLMTILRTKRREQDRIARLEPRPEADESQDIKHQQRRLDVRDAVADLSADERQLCQALAAGRSIADIASAHGCGWHTIKRRVSRIRERFEAIGLDAWLGN